jgi:hypothetical protein
MAKVLLDRELGEIISRATQDPSIIDCADSYEYFLEDLAELVCTHFGGTRGNVAMPDDDMSWTVAIHINESVPSDGGVFAQYDTDVVWRDGEEER